MHKVMWMIYIRNVCSFQCLKLVLSEQCSGLAVINYIHSGQFSANNIGRVGRVECNLFGVTTPSL